MKFQGTTRSGQTKVVAVFMALGTVLTDKLLLISLVA